jgi:hypothetical protein
MKKLDTIPGILSYLNRCRLTNFIGQILTTGTYSDILFILNEI